MWRTITLALRHTSISSSQCCTLTQARSSCHTKASPNPAPCDNLGTKMHLSVASTSLAQTCGNPGTFFWVTGPYRFIYGSRSNSPVYLIERSVESYVALGIPKSKIVVLLAWCKL